MRPRLKLRLCVGLPVQEHPGGLRRFRLRLRLRLRLSLSRRWLSLSHRWRGRLRRRLSETRLRQRLGEVGRSCLRRGCRRFSHFTVPNERRDGRIDIDGAPLRQQRLREDVHRARERTVRVLEHHRGHAMHCPHNRRVGRQRGDEGQVDAQVALANDPDRPHDALRLSRPRLIHNQAHIPTREERSRPVTQRGVERLERLDQAIDGLNTVGATRRCSPRHEGLRCRRVVKATVQSTIDCGLHEGVRVLNRGRLGARHDEPFAREVKEIERPIPGAGPKVDEQRVRLELQEAAHQALALAPPRICGPQDRCSAADQAQTVDRRRQAHVLESRDPARPEVVQSRRRVRDPKQRVHVRCAQVGVEHNDPRAESRHRGRDGTARQALADAALAPTERDDET